MEKKVYAFLLAGGNGERLWPLSRRNKPKQLLTLEEDRSLLEDSIDRIDTLIPQNNRWIITTQHHAEEVVALVGDRVGLVHIEPRSKNTGPAILLSALALYDADPDALVVVLPTDHFIPDQDTFTEFLFHALDSAHQEEKIVLLGAKPSYAATGYGYIEYRMSGTAPYKVARFHEKPSAELAHKYLTSSNTLWNMGIFCTPIHTLIAEYKKHAPELFNAVAEYSNGSISYDEVPAIAIDHAIMEKSKKLMVMPVHFVWSDVGNLATFLSLREQHKKLSTEVISIDSNNNLIEVDNNLVALIGIDDLCIVQTDEILLIAKRDETEKVKLVLDTLKLNNSDEYL